MLVPGATRCPSRRRPTVLGPTTPSLSVDSDENRWGADDAVDSFHARVCVATTWPFDGAGQKALVGARHVPGSTIATPIVLATWAQTGPADVVRPACFPRPWAPTTPGWCTVPRSGANVL